jgi:hypothetical protein
MRLKFTEYCPVRENLLDVRIVPSVATAPAASPWYKPLGVESLGNGAFSVSVEGELEDQTDDFCAFIDDFESFPVRKEFQPRRGQGSKLSALDLAPLSLPSGD